MQQVLVEHQVKRLVSMLQSLDFAVRLRNGLVGNRCVEAVGVGAWVSREPGLDYGRSWQQLEVQVVY